jgi:hypothetical protein
MAENFNFTEGTGAVGAADDISGVKYQKVKLVDGTEDATTIIAAGVGVAANALRVALATSSEIIANLSATDNAVLDAIQTAIEACQTALEATLTIEGTVDVVGSLPAGENHLGEIGLADDTITITCTLDTDAYADGDVLFDTQEIANAVRVNGDTCILQSVHVIDIDDQGKEMDLIFFNAATSLGTENSAPDIDDSDVLTTLGKVNISADDYIDLGANRIATVQGIGLVLEAGAATTSLYVAGITRGTPTHSATGLTIKFGLLRN